jgi:Zn-dependent peptidase ImmA (M78 family)
VGTTQPKISQLEKGTYVSADLLDAIADVTQFSREWFDRGPLPDLPTGSLRFRKRADTRVRDDDRVRAHVRQAVEIVERFSGIAQVPLVRLTPVKPDAVSTIDDIEDIALDVREQIGVGPEDPIPNLTRAIERSGVIVIGSVSTGETEKHGGASFWPDYPLGRPIICIGRGRSGDSQRFTAAHEIGHLVLHQFRNVDAKRGELEAHRFAGALLIPRDSAIDCMEPPITLRTLALVKERWGIAIRALIKRCLDLQIIDAHHRLSLEKQIAARGWTREEPVPVPYEEPALLRRLIEMGLGSAGASAAQRLGLPPLAIRDLVA